MDSSEEYLGDGLHIIQQHLLESPLILRRLFVDLLRVVPHFKDDYLVNVPVFALIFELVETLGFLLLVFGNPVSIRLALLCQKIGLDCSIGVFDMF